MMIQIEMGPEFAATIADLGAQGEAVINACSRGLKRGVNVAAGRVATDYLSGQSLRRRTGSLARNVKGWMADKLEGVVGVQPASMVDKYKWLLGSEEMTITPKRAKALTIPIGEALTASGAAKYPSAAEAARELGVKLFRPKGTNVLGYVRGKKGKFRALFALVKSVFVQGSDALYDGVDDSLDEITQGMQSEVDKAIGG